MEISNEFLKQLKSDESMLCIQSSESEKPSFAIYVRPYLLPGRRMTLVVMPSLGTEIPLDLDRVTSIKLLDEAEVADELRKRGTDGTEKGIYALRVLTRET